MPWKPIGPFLGSNINEYTVKPPKPEVKQINIFKMVGSDIDMEFSNDDEWRCNVGSLCNLLIEHEFPYYDILDDSWIYCRIREGHWFSWLGGDCPLPEGLVIDVVTRGDGCRSNVADFTMPHWDWSWNDLGQDIIAFKVVGTAEGWVYPWEDK